MDSQLWVNTLFRGRQVAEFLAVKRHLGMQSNTEVIRHLIHKQARILRRRALPRRSPSAQAPAPSVPTSLDRPGQERAGPLVDRPFDPSDIQSLCLSCPLPDCDESDPNCPYRQAKVREHA
jgi:hypothetical protein